MILDGFEMPREDDTLGQNPGYSDLEIFFRVDKTQIDQNSR